MSDTTPPAWIREQAMIVELQAATARGFVYCQSRDISGKLCHLFKYTRKTDAGGYWNAVTLAARGIIFADNGELLALPMRKFHNVDAVGPIPSLSPGTGLHISVKHDGHSGILFWDGDTPHMAYSGSFNNSIGLKLFKEHMARHRLQPKCFSPNFYTFQFEVIAPETRVFVNYGDRRQLYLVAIMDKTTRQELPESLVDIIATNLFLKRPRSIAFRPSELYQAKSFLAKFETLGPQFFEGFVLRERAINGQRWKWKTPARKQAEWEAINAKVSAVSDSR